MKTALSPRFTALLLGLGLLVPLSAEEQRAKAPGRDASPKIELNSATEKALAAVPEIGPDGARAIIAARPFASLDELDRVRGLNSERLEQIRARVSVAPAGTRAGLGEPTRERRPLGMPRAGAEEATRASRLLDLNTATEAQLAAVPVIGPELAKTIVARRPFRRLDEMSALPGLSSEQLEQIRGVVRVAPEAPAAPHAPRAKP